MSGGRFFLDTNVFIYTFDQNAAQKAALATQLIKTAIDSHQGSVSYQVVQEFFNVAFRRFTKPMNEAEAQQYLATTFRPLLSVHSSVGLMGAALRIKEKYKFSWYDALIFAAAVECQCETLYSEDFQHGQKVEAVVVKNPFL